MHMIAYDTSKFHCKNWLRSQKLQQRAKLMPAYLSMQAPDEKQTNAGEVQTRSDEHQTSYMRYMTPKICKDIKHHALSHYSGNGKDTG